LGQAWLLGCPDERDVEILTGNVRIRVYGTEPALQLAKSLRQINSSDAPGLLAAPRRFSCREVAGFPSRFRTTLPPALRPSCP
jgi:hypothetical protein